MSAKIEKARIKDIPRLLELWQELMDFHKEIEQTHFELKRNAKSIMKKWFLKNILKKNSILLKATIGKKVVGYVLAFVDKFPPVYKKDKYVYVSDGYVMEEYRSRGIMKEMMFEVTEFYRSRGMGELWLRCFSKNKLAVHAWEGIGFEEENKFMVMDI